jgi:hypothetical protein
MITSSQQKQGLLRFRPHHHVFGFLAAVASEEAFVQVDELGRRPRENDTHFIETAGRAGPGDNKTSGVIVRSPVDICFGTSPSQAPKSRPLETRRRKPPWGITDNIISA